MKHFFVLAIAAIALSGCECGMGRLCKKKELKGMEQEVVVPVIEETDVVVTEQEDLGDPFPVQDRVYYGFDTSALNASAQRDVDAQIQWLMRNPGVSVIVEGHCDERGTREYNLALGERRANAVKDYMIAHGIHADRITVISYGKDRPVVLGSTPEAWAKNRVGITVVQ